jgi:protocatechuate 3,4-dioxygenase beta subunit
MMITPDPMPESGPQPHGGGAHEDGLRIAVPVGRRRAMRWLAGAGSFALLGGCGSGAGDGRTVIPPGPTPTPTPTPSPLPSPTASALGTRGCTPTPSEIRGPFPADGTTASSGVTGNVLIESGVMRSDLRASFIGSTSIAPGVRLTLTLTLLNGDAGCAPLAGHIVYLWSADARGRYSLYTAPGESWLRGARQTDANGRVTFTTIVPGCYAGRYPHLHFEVFASAAAATHGDHALLVGQIIIPESLTRAVYADGSAYPGSAANLAGMTVANDAVFGDDSDSANAARMLAAAGNPAAGYDATVAVVVHAGPPG